ncbi:Mitochondrial sodium/hydrogen exchanger NHA2 [Trachymyrmex cornetzi]|uniref:Mitochondrial sodium/hydrogen exchanger NHA2 n=2 Tax=Trachymyrmex cornetzi TaxID=471704 RepID=A0A195E5D5_9HYME|nr:Mitochondrial sodium/hydrogen exchanger NHA2 [Trachymyrmex cornetzi]
MDIEMGGRTNKPSEELAKRRVSISDQVIGLDNPVFEHHRRISAGSEHNSDQGRRKSILHHGGSHCDSVENIPQYKFDLENGRINGNRKKSAYSLSSSIRDKIEYSEELKRSWLYLFCARCHGLDDTPSWEPPGWRKACPQPFCPTYRKFARIVCLFLLGLLLWGVIYSIIGNDAAPGGQLFGLAAVCIAAHFGGWLFSLTTLPALIGMLITGLILQNVGLVKIEGQYTLVVSNLRKISLVIILVRAGLDLDPVALKKLKVTLPKLSLIPWVVETIVGAVSTKYLLNLPWVWGFLLGSVIAAVSPAVVVSCLFRLRAKGYGVAKGIPTLIIAISGIDDAISVAVFSIVKSVIFSHDALWYQILQGPISIIGGLGFGIMWGWLAKYVPEKGDATAANCIENYDSVKPRFCDCSNAGVFGTHEQELNRREREKKLLLGVSDTEEVLHGAESRGVSVRCRRCVLNILFKLQPYSHHSQVMSVAPFIVPLRVLMLLGGGLLAVFGSEAIELAGAGPLAVVAAAFVSCYFWQQDGWDMDDNPVATSFEIFWMIFEPILFGLTGTQIKISELEGKTVYLGLGCLLAGIVIRIGITMLLGIGSKLNLKEKVFISLALMSKATVQAALAPVTLDEVDKNDQEQVEYADIVLMMCVLSVLLTAPAGAILITILGPKLLTKTTVPVTPPEAWKTRRPSIRDISIINEDPDLEETANERKP